MTVSFELLGGSAPIRFRGPGMFIHNDVLYAQSRDATEPCVPLLRFSYSPVTKRLDVWTLGELPTIQAHVVTDRRFRFDMNYHEDPAFWAEIIIV